MAEQIPVAWVGQEVIVYFEPAQRQAGTLEDVSERGIVVRSTRDETIAMLRDQLEAERQAHAEARRLLMAALERIPPQLEAPSEARESPVPNSEGQSPTPEEGPRAWWRRWFGA